MRSSVQVLLGATDYGSEQVDPVKLTRITQSRAIQSPLKKARLLGPFYYGPSSVTCLQT